MPQLVMVILPMKLPRIYGRLKLIGDCEFIMPTQFILRKNVKADTCHQLLLKINSKLGGTNQVNV